MYVFWVVGNFLFKILYPIFFETQNLVSSGTKNLNFGKKLVFVDAQFCHIGKHQRLEVFKRI